jgi:hypothetical protein
MTKSIIIFFPKKPFFSLEIIEFCIIYSDTVIRSSEIIQSVVYDN